MTSKTIETELLACPFCGCDRIYERGFRCFECPECRAEGPTKATKAEAVAAWNTRAALSRAPGVEELGSSTRMTSPASRSQTPLSAGKPWDLYGPLADLTASLEALISESDGVYGLHRNGDLAPWDELLAGGRFEDWLRAAASARRALDSETAYRVQPPSALWIGDDDAADAARYRHLKEHHSYYHAEQYDQPQPREFGIQWEHQDCTPARPSMDWLIDQEIAAKRLEDEECRAEAWEYDPAENSLSGAQRSELTRLAQDGPLSPPSTGGEGEALIMRVGERIADEVEKVAAGRQSNCEQAARDIVGWLHPSPEMGEISREEVEELAEDAFNEGWRDREARPSPMINSRGNMRTAWLDSNARDAILSKLNIDEGLLGEGDRGSARAGSGAAGPSDCAEGDAPRSDGGQV